MNDKINDTNSFPSKQDQSHGKPFLLAMVFCFSAMGAAYLLLNAFAA